MIPKIYDPAMDEWREVTQADVDLLSATAQKYGQLRLAVFKLMADAETIQSPALREV